MLLELHVWGSAFSLPSIDPHCLAAIFYLSGLTAHSTTELRWVLIESSEANISPTRQLPALHDPGTGTTIGGYQNIVSYLQELDSAWDIDLEITRDSGASADLIAFSQHILTHGQSLLDLSLFVSSENYTSTTRPTYSSLLPWPLPFFLLPELRQAAKRRTVHLGLSSLDLDDEDGKQDSQSRQAHDLTPVVSEHQRKQHIPSLIPASLRTAVGSAPPSTVTAFVKMANTANRFRLEAEVDTFCAPLNELLLLSINADSDDQKRTISRLLLPPLPSSSSSNEEKGSRSYSSLACLALGYLSIMLHADVPHAWLREGIRSRYADLAAYAEAHTHRIRSMARHQQRQLPSESTLRAELSTWSRLQSRLPFHFSTSRSSSPLPSSSSSSAPSSSPVVLYSTFSMTTATITAYLPLVFATILLSGLAHRSDAFPSLFPIAPLARLFGARGLGFGAEAGGRTGVHVFHPPSRSSSAEIRASPTGGGVSLEDFGAAGQLIRDALVG